MQCFRLHPDSVVGDPYDQPFFRQCQPNRDYTDPYLSFQSMNNCILHKRLHRQLWDLTILDPRLRIVDLQAKPISEPKLLDRKICLNILQFFGYANKIFNLADGIPEKLCQVFCHIRHDIETARNRLTADPLQRIIEEMWINLVLQSKILRLTFADAQELAGVQQRHGLFQRHLGSLTEITFHVTYVCDGITCGIELHDLFVFLNDPQTATQKNPTQNAKQYKQRQHRQPDTVSAMAQQQTAERKQHRQNEHRQYDTQQIIQNVLLFLLLHFACRLSSYWPARRTIKLFELSRPECGHALEYTVECPDILISDLITHLGDRQIGAAQQLLCAVDAQHGQIVLKSHSCFLLELGAEIIRTESRNACDLFQRDIIHILLFHELLRHQERMGLISCTALYRFIEQTQRQCI